MAERLWLNDAQWVVIEPLLPRLGGKPRVDDRRVISGVLHRYRECLRWRTIPAEYGPRTTLFNRFNLWSAKGISAPPPAPDAASHLQDRLARGAPHPRSSNGDEPGAPIGGEGKLVDAHEAYHGRRRRRRPAGAVVAVSQCGKHAVAGLRCNLVWVVSAL
jgi:hypothetical protein